MHIPPEEYYKNLPKKQLASGVLFFNTAGELLIVKPNYKEEWIIPGGVIEAFESPKATCVREVKEELGIQVEIGRLLCFDFMIKDMPGTTDQRENIQLIFDGGVLTEAQIASIRLQIEELSAYQFVSPARALQLLTPGLIKRLPLTLDALRDGSCAYLEQGVTV
jgi:8-oxo-dGTP pyrophosphatase MutT (NUDIX family)